MKKKTVNESKEKRTPNMEWDFECCEQNDGLFYVRLGDTSVAGEYINTALGGLTQTDLLTMISKLTITLRDQSQSGRVKAIKLTSTR